MFGWLKKNKRKKLLAATFPPEWESILLHNIRQYKTLSAAEKKKLRDDLRVFIAEKNWEGCAGFEITDEVKVTVAGYACLLTLGFDADLYSRLLTILVYPTEFAAKETRLTDSGFHTEEYEEKEGESWSDGTIILSWDSVTDLSGGVNVAIHEFAHVLDIMSYGGQEVLQAEYDDLVRRSKRGERTVLDEYGTTDLAEFFAVATEAFFQRPFALSKKHARLYDLLRGYYHQDPAARERA